MILTEAAEKYDFPLDKLCRAVSAAAFGSGHINDTFALTVEKPASDAFVRFVLQRINPHVFPNPLAVMDNIVRVTRHLKEKYAILPDAARRVLTVVPSKEAKPCWFDDSGACWRCYRMIEGAGTVDAVREPAQARTASFAFARFARDLSDLPPPRLQVLAVQNGKNLLIQFRTSKKFVESSGRNFPSIDENPSIDNDRASIN